LSQGIVGSLNEIYRKRSVMLQVCEKLPNARGYYSREDSSQHFCRLQSSIFKNFTKFHKTFLIFSSNSHKTSTTPSNLNHLNNPQPSTNPLKFMHHCPPRRSLKSEGRTSRRKKTTRTFFRTHSCLTSLTTLSNTHSQD
jgi:hypothetical protein